MPSCPPTLLETYAAANKVKAGKAPGSCGVSLYPEYILHGGNEALKTLHSIFTRVWEDEVVPEEWHQGIIIPLYKGKGSRSDCSNYRGITLLSVSGKVFAKVILSRIRPTLLAHSLYRLQLDSHCLQHLKKVLQKVFTLHEAPYLSSTSDSPNRLRD